MFFGRRLRGRLPHLPGANDLDIGNAIDGANQRKLLMETMETQSGTPLKTLNSGQRVLVQNPISKSWDEKGIVLDVTAVTRKVHTLSRGIICSRNSLERWLK